jgi:thioesterase domain-containing protein/acyl carrier protein
MGEAAQTSRASETVQDTRTSTVEILATIWKKVLQLEAIDPNDNFFELGGDSALAVQLFSEIEDIFGRQLPAVMIYHVPTIASQVALLELRSAPELSPLVLLKSGRQEQSLFIASGLGGGPAEFFQLAKYMQTPYGIFGLQPKGIEGFDEPCERIEDMADFYLRAILRFQPHGPYLLAGYSLGGLVALEMAHSLTSKGQTVALLTMIDSYPDIDFLSAGERLRLSIQRTLQRTLNFIRPQGTRIRLGGLSSQDEISRFAPAFDRVREAAYKGLRQYKPRFYPGEVKFVRAAEVTQFPADPEAVWSRLVNKIEIDTVPGDHLGMLTTQYETLASVLNRYLESVTIA